MVVRMYQEGDDQFIYDAINEAIVDEAGMMIMNGDWYHDEISAKIEGFFEALNYLGVEYEKIEVKRNEGGE